MLIRKNKQVKKVKSHKRISLILFAFLLILSNGIFPGIAESEIKSRGPNLKQVGPINESNGFPLWYKDSNNTKLQLCLDPNEPLCGLVVEDFNPLEEITFPKNYPGEAFYQLAEAAMESPDRKSDVIAVFALEATFNSEVPAIDDQTVFGRIRFRIDNLIVGENYKITHPYGVDEFKAEPENKKAPNGPGEINYTEDIGAGQTFAGALNSRIGTFLTAVSPAPPPGYTGNPNVEQTVTGGVNNQNFLRIEGPGIGLIYPDFKCESNPNDCIETNLFSLAGKIASNNGLDIQQATYKQTTSDGGSIDVFVSSEIEQTIEVSGAGIVTTSLAEGTGQYYAHVPYTGTKPPAEVTLTNIDDTPDTIKTIALVDQITASAYYAPGSKILTLIAKSSDEVEPPTLTAKGFGDINPETGTLVIPNLSYISPTITITSTNKGTVTIPVNIVSSPVSGAELEANAGLDLTDIKQGTVVTLDGRGSKNAIAYSWKQTSGPTVALSSANIVNPTFTFPKQPEPIVFELTVTGVDGKTATDTVEISTVPDNLTVNTAEYRFSNGRGNWRIIGTSDVFGPDVRITIKVVDTANPNGVRIGSAIVDNSGGWRFISPGQTIIQGATLIIESSSGGILTNEPVTITN